MKKQKLKKCINCSELFEPKSSLQIACGFDCALIIGKQKALQKQNKIAISLQNYKNELGVEKTLKASLINTKIQIHAYIRKRDKFKPCISCGAEWNNNFEAGHFFSANSFVTLKFHLDNIHGQCFYCNNKLEGNHQNYALRLPERIGQNNFDALIELAKIDKQRVKVWNIENLKEIRDVVKQLNEKL